MVKPQKRYNADDIADEFEEKVVHINRCTKVTTGGRKFSFSALIIVGNKKGYVGYASAKANEVSDAIRKATDSAKKNVYKIELEGTSIPHEVLIDQDGAKLLLKPAPLGTGVIAGSKVRAVLELAGIKDVIAKNLGSSNPTNQVKATFKAFSILKNRELTRAERKGENTNV